MDVRVRVLGEFEIEGLALRQLGSRKARRLLKILALGRGRPIGVGRLIECLWPEDTAAPHRPEEQVAVLVSRLRGVLGADKLVRTDAGYKLVFDWLDLVALEELTATAMHRLAAGNYALARTAGEAGLALIRGPLLDDEPHAAWVMGERAAAERLVAEAQLTAARAALSCGDAVGAAAHAAAMFERNPIDEAALRLLMEAHTAAGRPALAIAAYGRARERLSDELGVEPAAETESMYLRILRQERLPAAAHAAVAAHQRQQRGPAVLPGRMSELLALDAALERADAGTVELLLVEGEAGIGKSRLLQTWADGATVGGVLVLSARCDELERSLPLQPVADALDGYL